MYSLLFVEDDKLLNQGITYVLQKDYHITAVTTYGEALAKIKEQEFDLALLDIALPDGDGLQLCKRLHEETDTSIILLTAKDTSQDIIQGFLSGCDDYIAKPFELEVLKHRILAVLRRATKSNSNLFKYNDFYVNFDKMQVIKNKEEIKLTATEYKLLTILIKNKGQVLTRDLLLTKLWDIDENFVDENTLNVNIRRLRQKVEDDPKNPKLIITVFGIGYTWGEST